MKNLLNYKPRWVNIVSEDKQNILLNIFLNKNKPNKQKYSKSRKSKLTMKRKIQKGLHKCLSKYTYIKDLGQGSYGKVYLVEKDNKQYAIKVQPLEKSFYSKKELIDTINNEIKAIQMGEKKIGPKIYEYYTCKDKGIEKVFIVMEHMTEGNLKDWLENNVLTKTHQKQIKDKLDKMHKLNYYHSEYMLVIF